MNAKTTVVAKLTQHEADAIASRLTNPGSEFQHEVRNRNGSLTPVAIVFDRSQAIVSWAATHTWRGQQTLEGFTSPESRNRGCARVAAAMLIADGHVDTSRPVAVFAPSFVFLARSLGCTKISLFERRGDDWILNS